MTWSIIAQITKCHHHLSHLAPYTGEEESPLQSFWSSQGALGHRCWKVILTKCFWAGPPLFQYQKQNSFQPTRVSIYWSFLIGIRSIFFLVQKMGRAKTNIYPSSCKLKAGHEMFFANIRMANFIFGASSQFVFRCYIQSCKWLTFHTSFSAWCCSQASAVLPWLLVSFSPKHNNL